MHPSSAMATVLVDELVRGGVEEVVLCPGSRSAPFAYVVQQAEREGRLRIHVRVDERSAGFLALGLARGSRRPTVVLTTSGTAVANLHPAVLEAQHSAVPLVLLSADRPAELRGTGANQTTRQPGLFTASVRHEVDLPAPEQRTGQVAWWRTSVCRALAAAVGAGGSDAGPVHLNVGLRDPLVPALGDDGWPEDLGGRPGGAPWTSVPTATASRRGSGEDAGLASVLDVTPRTLVLLGDLPDPAMTVTAVAVAREQGWPVVAEPFGRWEESGAGDPSTVLPHGPLLLTREDLLESDPPDRVLVVGRLTLSRESGALLRRPHVRVEQVSAVASWSDPSHVVAQVWPWAALAGLLGSGRPRHPGFAARWVRAGQAVSGAVADQVATGAVGVAGAVLAALEEEDTLVLGSSNPPRDLAFADPGGPGATRTVLANRGLAGIDGAVSTAVGVALRAPRRTIALLGDLTVLHDLNGLLIGPGEPRPDLTIVVPNDDGGGIFATMEYGEPQRAGDFERVFATPTGADLSALCQGYGVPHRRVAPAQLATALADRPAGGVSLIEVPVDRAVHREHRAALIAAARAAAIG